jgi:cytochrome d ubiquinol oxidase subunit II
VVAGHWGTLFFTFPRLYAAGFNGFYLPLMIVLWLLMLRGLALELRGHIQNGLVRPVGRALLVGSTLLAIFMEPRWAMSCAACR